MLGFIGYSDGFAAWIGGTSAEESFLIVAASFSTQDVDLTDRQETLMWELLTRSLLAFHDTVVVLTEALVTFGAHQHTQALS